MRISGEWESKVGTNTLHKLDRNNCYLGFFINACLFGDVGVSDRPISPCRAYLYPFHRPTLCVLTTMASPPNIISIHTPSASFAIVHSSMSSPSSSSLFLIIGLVNEDSLEHLFDKLSRKSHTDFHGQRVGPGWIKYHWNDTFWNLDDGRSLVLCNIEFVD